MATPVLCLCGKLYQIEDKFQGRTFTCQACQAQLTVPSTPSLIRTDADAQVMLNGSKVSSPFPKDLKTIGLILVASLALMLAIPAFIAAFFPFAGKPLGSTWSLVGLAVFVLSVVVILISMIAAARRIAMNTPPPDSQTVIGLGKHYVLANQRDDICPNCHQRCAARLSGVGWQTYKAAGKVFWDITHVKQCPHCQIIPCFVEGCNARSEITLAQRMELFPGDHKTTKTRDDACLCKKHYAELTSKEYKDFRKLHRDEIVAGVVTALAYLSILPLYCDLALAVEPQISSRFHSILFAWFPSHILAARSAPDVYYLYAIGAIPLIVGVVLVVAVQIFHSRYLRKHNLDHGPMFIGLRRKSTYVTKPNTNNTGGKNEDFVKADFWVKADP